MNAWRLGCCVAALVAASAIAQTGSVFINGAALDADKRRALEQAYGVPIQPGRYWYDAMSGVWGREGGPALGQVHPNLQLGPRLRADASNGNTRVFVNGRELHTMDVLALRRCTPVIPGRYWVLANGIGGYEGVRRRSTWQRCVQPPAAAVAAAARVATTTAAASSIAVTRAPASA